MTYKAYLHQQTVLPEADIKRVLGSVQTSGPLVRAWSVTLIRDKRLRLYEVLTDGGEDGGVGEEGLIYLSTSQITQCHVGE